MKNKNISDQHIIQYITGKLSDEQHAILDFLVDEDDAFAARVDQLQKQVVSDFLGEPAEQAAQTAYAEHKKKVTPQPEEAERDTPIKPLRRRSLLLPLAAVAALIIILIIVGSIATRPYKLENMQLAAVEDFQTSIEVIDGEDQSGGNDAEDTWLIYFRNKNYERAIEKLDLIDPDTSFYPRAQYYKGRCLLYQGKYDQAKTKFEEVSNMDLQANRGLHIPLNYYLATIALYQNDIPTAKRLFGEIKYEQEEKYGNDYRKKAFEMDQRLSSGWFQVRN